MTFTITGHDVWTVGKYAMAAIGGGVVVFLAFVYWAQRGVGRFFGW